MWTQEQKDKLFSHILVLQGEGSRIDMVVEEMSELTHALMHWRRDGFLKDTAALNKIAEEYADTLIVLEQLHKICADANPKFEPLVAEYTEAKLTRLAQRVNQKRVFDYDHDKARGRENKEEK